MSKKGGEVTSRSTWPLRNVGVCSAAPVIIIEGDEYPSSPIDPRPKFLHYQPHIALISSIGHAHIEFFDSRAGIAAAKCEIMTGMPKGGLLYLPAKTAELKTLTAIAKRQEIQIKRIIPEKSGVWNSNFALASTVAK